MSRKNSLLNLKASLPSGLDGQCRHFCGLNEDGCCWSCGLLFSGGKRVSSTFPKSRPTLTARHRPKLPDTIRNFRTPSEIARHCPKFSNTVRNYPTPSEVARHCPKQLDTGRHRPKLADISHVRSPRPLASQVCTLNGLNPWGGGRREWIHAGVVRGFPLPVWYE